MFDLFSFFIALLNQIVHQHFCYEEKAGVLYDIFRYLYNIFRSYLKIYSTLLASFQPMSFFE